MWSCARGIDFSPNSEDLSPKTPCLLGRGCLSLGRGLLTKGWGISSGEKLPWVDAQVSPSTAPGVLPWLRAGSAPKGWGDGQTVVRCSQWGWWRGRCRVIYTPHARSSHMGGASAHVSLVVLTDFHKGGGEVSPWPPQLTVCSGFQLQLQAGPRWRPDVSGTEQTEWDRLAGLDGAESWGEKSCMDRDQLPVQGQVVSWSAEAQGPGESERCGGLSLIFLFRGARNLEYLPLPPASLISRGEGCVVNISPTAFLTYCFPRVEKTLEGGSQLGWGQSTDNATLLFHFCFARSCLFFHELVMNFWKCILYIYLTWSWFFSLLFSWHSEWHWFIFKCETDLASQNKPSCLWWLVIFIHCWYSSVYHKHIWFKVTTSTLFKTFGSLLMKMTGLQFSFFLESLSLDFVISSSGFIKWARK